MTKKLLLGIAIMLSAFAIQAQKANSLQATGKKMTKTVVTPTDFKTSNSENSLFQTFAGVRNPLKSRGIPASPYSYSRILPDGNEITLVMRGDAVVNWEETEDGYTVFKNNDGFYVYAAIDKNGNLMPTNIIASNAQNRTSMEQTFLSGISKHLTFSSQQIEQEFNNYYAEERNVKSADKSFPTTGTRKLITILVEFPDETFTRTQSEFNDLFNGSNYTLEGATGSVKTYYADNSFDQLDLTTDVVGPYTLPNNMAYYGGNDGSGDDLRPQEMISDAIALANPDVDFSDYDNDGDGYVDGVYVVYAGYSEASGASEDAIWPHRWALPWPGEDYDGVTVYDYSCSNELYGNSGTYITGIGTVCHEFGHNCGLPDYYDTDYTGSGGEAFTLGAWDVMDGGAYNNYGCTPPFFNSFSRYIVGWQTPTLLQSPETVALPNTAENNISYYYNTQTSNEYFLLENRQKISWDLYIPHHGLIIYHVDEDYIASNGNYFNTDPDFQGFDLVEADNTQTEGSRTGDPFPGASNNTSFTDATTPSAQSYSSQNTNKPVTDIQEISQIIYFDFMGGAVSGVPVAEFTADNTTVLVGQTVNFTDLSTGVPDDYSWTFDGGTPGVSTDPDPSIVYNTPGTYDVTLYVSNTHGNHQITKTGYITVTSAPVTCEYVDNFEDTDSESFYYTMGDEYVTGHNEYVFTEFAEHYTNQLNNLVTGVSIAVGMAEALSSDAKITMKIWDDNSGFPGTVLYSEDIDIADFTVDAYNNITFASPTTVPSDFFIGYQIYYNTPQDTFAVYQAYERGAGSPIVSTAFVKYNGTWRDMNVLFGNNLNTALCVYPYICPSPPTADFSADVTSGCDNLTVQFTDLSTSNTDSWSWDFGDGSPLSTEASPTHTYSSPGTYTVTLTATNGVGSDDEEKIDFIVVGTTPTAVTVTGGGTQCGGTMVLNASGGTGGTIYWQGTTPDGTSTTTPTTAITVTETGVYYFRSQSPQGCWSDQGSATVTINSVPTTVTVSGGGTQCGGSITLTAIGGTGGTIYWQNTTNNGTSITTASSSQTVSASGTYYFRAQSAAGCWGDQGSATVTINEVPQVVSVTGGGTQCGGTMDLTASGGAGGTIYWQGTTSNGTSTVTPTSAQTVTESGTYYFRSQSAQGCWGDQGSAVVTINEIPDPVTVSGGGTQCGGTMILTANGGDGGTIYFQGTTSGGTSVANVSSIEEIAVSGDYYFRAQSAEGCWGDEGSATVTIYPALTIEMSSTNESTPEANDGTVTVTVLTGTPDYTYVWGPPAQSETGSNLTGLAGGNYCITVLDGNGCDATDCITVNTDGAAPIANFTADLTTGCDNLTVTFTDASSNNPTSWDWDFGDGTSSSNETNPVHEYTSPGVYTVTMEATNSTGSDDIIKTDFIIVGETPEIDFVVTPASGELVADGAISVTVTGGEEPYGVVWDHDALETSLELTSLVPGSYYLTVTENNNCSINETIEVNWVNFIDNQNSNIAIFPNPAQSQITILSEGNMMQSISITNVLGEVVYTSDNKTDVLHIDISDFASGTYFVKIDLMDRSIVQKMIKQ
ncbi:MAG: M6 family metalloprotease domain-containing protein [Bacteroidales bacterium]|nr:M6 family metalloprotease domain-containing protein [Bacteroidales bacterium]